MYGADGDLASLRPWLCHEENDLPPAAESVLNPFSVFRKGEVLLRRQLAALSGWHLVNIIVAHRLSGQDAAALSATPDDVLVELIVSEVRARSQHPA